MLYKTDFRENVRRAKITLEFELSSQFYQRTYDSYAESGKIDLIKVAEALRDIESKLSYGQHGIIMTLSTVTPVGYNYQREWLVAVLVDVGWVHQDEDEWRDFLAQTAAKIMLKLASKEGLDGGIAYIDTGSARFTVMEDPDGGTEPKDFIDV